MNLIKWSDNKIVIAPEAYGIKAFRNIWNSDKTKNKEVAILNLTAIFFMYDPRSEFQYEVEEGKRLEIIKEEVGLPSKWDPNKFKEAIDIYKYLTYTTSASILDGNRKAINSIRQVIETPIDDLKFKSPDDKLAYAEKLAKVVNIANKLAEDTAKAEKEIYKEVDEYSSKMRGSGSKTIGDEGIDNIFNE